MKGLPGPAKSQAQPQLPSIATLLGSLPPKHSPAQSLACRPLPPCPQHSQTKLAPRACPGILLFFYIQMNFSGNFLLERSYPSVPKQGVGTGWG